jgi:hypothetical protein
MAPQIQPTTTPTNTRATSTTPPVQSQTQDQQRPRLMNHMPSPETTVTYRSQQQPVPASTLSPSATTFLSRLRQAAYGQHGINFSAPHHHSSPAASSPTTNNTNASVNQRPIPTRSVQTQSPTAMPATAASAQWNIPVGGGTSGARSSQALMQLRDYFLQTYRSGRQAPPPVHRAYVRHKIIISNAC